MHRNSSGYFRYLVVALALSAILGGVAAAAVESSLPAGSQPPAKDGVDPDGADDESADGKAVEDQTGFNTLEDMLLFQGPLATLWAAPQSLTASVEWKDVSRGPAESADEDGKGGTGESNE